MFVDADRQMLHSAVANLLQNAFKFSRPEGHIALSARRGSADRVIIDVEDECGGLAPGATEKLFQPFEQASNDRTGLGLGLSISRRSVEANGGTLAVRSLPGQRMRVHHRPARRRRTRRLIPRLIHHSGSCNASAGPSPDKKVRNFVLPIHRC